MQRSTDHITTPTNSITNTALFAEVKNLFDFADSGDLLADLDELFFHASKSMSYTMLATCEAKKIFENWLALKHHIEQIATGFDIANHEEKEVANG